MIEEKMEASAGPDGVSYTAWKNCGRQRKIQLYRLYLHILSHGDAGAAFNEALFVLIPKQAENGVDTAWLVEQLRCLSLSNTDHKLVGSAINWQISQHVKANISKFHFGGFRGMQIQACILESETDAITAGGRSDKGYWMLADLKAAFPSISREFLLFVMGKFGVIDYVIAAIKTMWKGSTHVIVLGGRRWSRIDVGDSLLQGSPFSAPVFCIGVFAFACWIKGIIGAQLSFGAYLDDMNMVGMNHEAEIPKLAVAFRFCFPRQAMCSSTHTKLRSSRLGKTPRLTSGTRWSDVGKDGNKSESAWPRNCWALG